MTVAPAFAAYRACLESLTSASLDDLDALLAEQVRFRDPFHDTLGREAMKRAFAGLFATTRDVSFRVGDVALGGDRAFFHWTLEGRLGGRPWRVEGVTRVLFDAAGRVTSHEEFWDAASQLYERFPLIGPLLRLLRRRIARL